MADEYIEDTCSIAGSNSCTWFDILGLAETKYVRKDVSLGRLVHFVF
jgi:hypothetical protein